MTVLPLRARTMIELLGDECRDDEEAARVPALQPPSAILYFFCTLGRSPMTGLRSCRFRFPVMWAFRWRRPTLAYFSLPVPVTLNRFLTLLFVLFLLAMGTPPCGGADRFECVRLEVPPAHQGFGHWARIGSRRTHGTRGGPGFRAAFRSVADDS